MVQPASKRLLVESQLAAPSGVASLGADAKVPDTQLPDRLADAALTAKILTLVGPQSLDGGNASSTYTGTFNLDGGSAA